MNNHGKSTIVVILAGGFGTRIKHLLPNLPKPMAKVANKPFLEWIIDYLKKQNINDIVISTGYLSEVIEQYFQQNKIDKVSINCYRENEALGTAGGFLNAVKFSQKSADNWLVMNGDSLIFTDLKPLFNYLEDPTVDGAILGLALEDASRYGSLKYDQDFNLLNFAEKKAGKGVINAGVYLFKDSLIKKFKKQKPLSFENDVFPHLLQQKCKIKIHIAEAPFLDIGTPESLSKADNFIQENFIKKS